MKLFKHFHSSFLDQIVGEKGRLGQYYYYRNYTESFIKKYEDSSYFLDLYERCKNNKHIQTSSRISYSDKIEFGVNLKDVRKIKSLKFNHYKEVQEKKIALSRIKIGGHRTKLSMCFYNDLLFYYNYTFSNLKPSDRHNILEIIQEKYAIQGSSINLANTNFRDDQGNYLLIDDGVNLSIHYLQFRLDIYDQLKNSSNSEEISKENKEKSRKRELFHRL